MNRKLFGGLALAFAVSCVGVSLATDVYAGNAYRIEYYADATLTGPPVGNEVLHCTGNLTHSGIVTDYSIYTEVTCPE